MKKTTSLFAIALLMHNPFSMAAAAAATTPYVVNMTVTENGYEPQSIEVPAGAKLVLKVTRKTEATCATDISIPSKKIQTALPLNKEVTVEVGTLEKGDVNFSCAMHMIKGTIHVK